MMDDQQSVKFWKACFEDELKKKRSLHARYAELHEQFKKTKEELEELKQITKQGEQI